MSINDSNDDQPLVISPNYINSLSPIKYEGVIEQVETEQGLNNAVAYLKKHQFIGLDTESRPSFEKGKIYPVSIVQIATPEKAFIVKIQCTGMVQPLRELFLSSEIVKVGVGLKDDFRRLKEIYKDLAYSSLLDLSDSAKKIGLQKTSLRALAAYYLERRLTKSAQKTNWARKQLTETQLRYAATDAWVCLLIREKMAEKNLEFKLFP